MNTLAINTIGEELERAAEFCRHEGIGLEVSDFAYPETLDGELHASIERHQKALEGIGTVSAHGPFYDLIATSVDPAIVELCRQRHQVSLEAAHAIGATIYVAHTNYIPLIKNPEYREQFAQRIADFWLPFADWAGQRDIIICLENLWEPGPEIQRDIQLRARHPHLKASFDNGHALVFSDVPAQQWIQTLDSEAAHFHLHDNWGEIDMHDVVGSGKECWKDLIHAVKRCSPDALLVAESDQLEKNRQSLEQLRTLLK